MALGHSLHKDRTPETRIPTVSSGRDRGFDWIEGTTGLLKLYLFLKLKQKV